MPHPAPERSQDGASITGSPCAHGRFRRWGGGRNAGRDGTGRRGLCQPCRVPVSVQDVSPRRVPSVPVERRSLRHGHAELTGADQGAASYRAGDGGGLRALGAAVIVLGQPGGQRHGGGGLDEPGRAGGSRHPGAALFGVQQPACGYSVRSQSSWNPICSASAVRGSGHAGGITMLDKPDLRSGSGPGLTARQRRRDWLLCRGRRTMNGPRGRRIGASALHHVGTSSAAQELVRNRYGFCSGMVTSG